MAVQIYQTLLATGKWGRNYTVGRSQKVQYVVEHHTATMASALNNLKYFASKYVGASAHYFIDTDGKIYQSVAEKDTAWSVGASKYKHARARNSNSISIEYVSDGRAFSEEQIKAGAALSQDIVKRYDLSNSAILRHYDVTGKNCPAHYLDANRWQALLARLTLGAANPVPVVPKPAPTSYTLKRLLKKGSKGADVKNLQQALNNLGYKLVVDGDFGAKTAKAVALFQGSKHLRRDTIVGKATAQALGWKWGV